MEPNVRLLRYFLAVADAGTFTAAAEVLHVSQPALSQQIRKLEGELGFTLFQRGTRHVTLTPHGRDLISSAPASVGLCPTPPRAPVLRVRRVHVQASHQDDGPRQERIHAAPTPA